MEKPPFSQNLPHPPHRIVRFSAKNACWWIFLLSPLLCLQNRPSAQETLNLPFSLQCVLAPSQYGLPPSFLNPALLSIHAQEGNPQYFIGSSAQMGFIKENGLYSLSSGIRYKKDAWNIHYLYKGFPTLNRQAAGLGYARNFLAGFSAGISATYQSTSKIEDRKRESLLDIGFSSAYQHKAFSLNFTLHYPVVLHSRQRKEWNRSLSLQIGASFRVFEGAHIGADLYKDLRYPLQAGIALSYLIKERFLVYGQTRVNPLSYQLGFAYSRTNLQVEIHCGYHPPLGFESSAGVVWKHLFKGKTTKTTRKTEVSRSASRP